MLSSVPVSATYPDNESVVKRQTGFFEWHRRGVVLRKLEVQTAHAVGFFDEIQRSGVAVGQLARLRQQRLQQPRRVALSGQRNSDVRELARSATPNRGFEPRRGGRRDADPRRVRRAPTGSSRCRWTHRAVRRRRLHRRFGRGADCDRIRKQHSQRSAFGFGGSDERGRATAGNEIAEIRTFDSPSCLTRNSQQGVVVR